MTNKNTTNSKTDFRALGLARLDCDAEPAPNCAKCPRLLGFLNDQRISHPDWWNAPVPTWHCENQNDVKLLIVGLAPGLQGANRTSRPFTGDWAGDLLYGTLKKFGLANGEYAQHALDGLKLNECAITNAVRCVPPQNKPIGAEINNCRKYLEPQFSRFENLRAILTLGTIAHNSTLRALNLKLKEAPFGHGLEKELDTGVTLFSSYHCSRYNTNTGKLTQAMFEAVFSSIRDKIDGQTS